MDELDGILDGHDVIVAVGVDQIHERREGGTLSATGRPGHEHESLAGFRKTAQRGRQMQRFEGRNLLRQQPDASRKSTSLIMHIRAKAADTLAAEAQIDRLVALQFLALSGRNQGKQQVARAFGR